MTKAAVDMSLAELERVVNEKKSALDRAIRRREQLRKELTSVEQRIAYLQGGRTGYSYSAKQPRGPRVRNEKSLHAVVFGLLTEHKDGMTLQDLHDAVLDSGYNTNSKNFKNVLYQCLYNSKHFTHDPGSGHYLLVSD